MVARRAFLGLLLLCLGSSLVGCSASGLDSIQVSPDKSGSDRGSDDATERIGTYGNGKHPYDADDHERVTWTSSTLRWQWSSTGLVVARMRGLSTITATTTGYNGPASSSATLRLPWSRGRRLGQMLTSLTILPGSQLVTNIGETSQYIAVGSYTGNPATQDLTNLVTWGSSDVFVAKIELPPV